MTGLDVQRSAVRAALAGDPLARAAMRDAILDGGVVADEAARAEVVRLGARVIDEPGPDARPVLGWQAPWLPVLRAAVRWAAGRFGDDSVAAGMAMGICAAHGWALDSRRAQLLIREMRRARRGAA